MITFTENAAMEIQKIMQKNELAEGVCVRVGVKGGGCAGFTYTPVSYTHLTLPTKA